MKGIVKFEDLERKVGVKSTQNNALKVDTVNLYLLFFPFLSPFLSWCGERKGITLVRIRIFQFTQWQTVKASDF